MCGLFRGRSPMWILPRMIKGFRIKLKRAKLQQIFPRPRPSFVKSGQRNSWSDRVLRALRVRGLLFDEPTIRMPQGKFLGSGHDPMLELIRQVPGWYKLSKTIQNLVPRDHTVHCCRFFDAKTLILQNHLKEHMQGIPCCISCMSEHAVTQGWVGVLFSHRQQWVPTTSNWGHYFSQSTPLSSSTVMDGCYPHTSYLDLIIWYIIYNSVYIHIYIYIIYIYILYIYIYTIHIVYPIPSHGRMHNFPNFQGFY